MAAVVVVVVPVRPQNHQIPKTILTGPLFFRTHKDRHFSISVTSPSLLYSNLRWSHHVQRSSAQITPKSRWPLSSYSHLFTCLSDISTCTPKPLHLSLSHRSFVSSSIPAIFISSNQWFPKLVLRSQKHYKIAVSRTSFQTYGSDTCVFNKLLIKSNK